MRPGRPGLVTPDALRNTGLSVPGVARARSSHFMTTSPSSVAVSWKRKSLGNRSARLARPGRENPANPAAVRQDLLARDLTLARACKLQFPRTPGRDTVSPGLVPGMYDWPATTELGKTRLPSSLPLPPLPRRQRRGRGVWRVRLSPASHRPTGAGPVANRTRPDLLYRAESPPVWLLENLATRPRRCPLPPSR